MEIIETKIYDNYQKLESIKEKFASFQSSYNVDYDYYYENCRIDSNTYDPFILTVEENENVLSMLVGRVQNNNLSIKFGYKELLKIRTKEIVFLYDGYLGIDTKENSQKIIECLRKLLSENYKSISIVRFNCLRTDTELFNAVKNVPFFLCRDMVFRKELHHIIELPETVDKMLEGMKSKHRSWIRKLERNLKNEFKDNVEYKVYTRPEDVNIMCSDVEKVAAQTYHRKLKFGFIHNQENEKRMHFWAEKNVLNGHIIYVHSKPVAFWIVLIYKRVCYLMYTGYNDDFKKYELGTILLLNVFKRCCTAGVQKIDCGPGNAFYKNRFSNISWEETNACIYASSTVLIIYNVVNSIVKFTEKKVKNILIKKNYLEKVKKKWRFGYKKKI